MRSRAVILPLACWPSTARADPACSASSRCASRVASLPAVVCGSEPAGSAGACDMVRTLVDVKSAGMTGEPSYADLERPPLSARALRSAATRVAPWREVHVLAEVSSTNDVASTAGRGGEAEGLVVVAEQQTGGRGRLGREWVSPPRAGLTFSVLLRPTAPAEKWPLLPLLVGVAVARAVRERTGVAVDLKWPNDLLVDGRKIGGILAEVAGAAVVIGIGLNVSTTADELPGPEATSVSLEVGPGESADRMPLLLAILRELGPRYLAWQDAGGGGSVVADFRALCDTVGREVRVALPGGAVIVGTATGIDDDGRLLVRAADGAVTSVSAGDVVHVRPTG